MTERDGSKSMGDDSCMLEMAQPFWRWLDSFLSMPNVGIALQTVILVLGPTSRNTFLPPFEGAQEFLEKALPRIHTWVRVVGELF